MLVPEDAICENEIKGSYGYFRGVKQFTRRNEISLLHLILNDNQRWRRSSVAAESGDPAACPTTVSSPFHGENHAMN
ncbi:MAG: hypothetical protein GX458_01375 [Phyllobacteriaceae bacterium]|nr:hypothetical protein [Phyllobacteriaceae bacterium]